jgi:hypothetical protein
LGREAVEGHAPGLVVATGGLDQPQRTGAGELVPVDVAGEVHRDLEDDVLDQGQVRLDEPRQLLVLALRAFQGCSPPPLDQRHNIVCSAAEL